MSEEEKKVAFELPKRSFSVEFWVGVFAILGIGCFAYLSLNIATMRITNSGYYPVTAVFVDISGLKIGSPVEIAGVQVGEVSQVDLNSVDAKVTMLIRDDVKLREDDIAQVRTKGIIGDKYIRISPGASDTTLVSGGQLTDTESAVDFEEVVGKIVHSLTDDSPKNDGPYSGKKETSAESASTPPARGSESNEPDSSGQAE